ncbi:hypothetical protein KS4_36010 [Poriferisphaera corsica]|uniref:Uncharacterized protein n=1 Tax=Poriferisphaera corsica TaxID=2528020 RepID=A0A517YZ63_9BACT|nr:hypothetical protein [Poriferisphaera corsica]QDU35518.1 hypothetical protein KS4_36010 [Poriferisphaera corsica]
MKDMDIKTETQDQETKTEEKKIAVTEAIRYRKRAQAAEKSLEDMAQKVEQLNGELEDTRKTVSHLERRQRIDALLMDERAVDIEAARLLTEVSVESMDDPDIEMVVNDLKESKPYLFKSSQGSVARMMAPSDQIDTDRDVSNAATEAIQTGRRSDLLRYLRIKRTKI